jgi:hypothetical protein
MRAKVWMANTAKIENAGGLFFPLGTCVGAGLPPEFSLVITVVALIVKEECATTPGSECCAAQFDWWEPTWEADFV